MAEKAARRSAADAKIARLEKQAARADQRVEQLRTERDEARAAIERVRAIHHPVGPYCHLCDPSYGAGDGSDGNNPQCSHKPRYCDVCRGPVLPCPTLAALDAPETPGDADA